MNAPFIFTPEWNPNNYTHFVGPPFICSIQVLSYLCPLPKHSFKKFITEYGAEKQTKTIALYSKLHAETQFESETTNSMNISIHLCKMLHYSLSCWCCLWCMLNSISKSEIIHKWIIFLIYVRHKSKFGKWFILKYVLHLVLLRPNDSITFNVVIVIIIQSQNLTSRQTLNRNF